MWTESDMKLRVVLGDKPNGVIRDRLQSQIRHPPFAFYRILSCARRL
jgi:hypothetical protein